MSLHIKGFAQNGLDLTGAVHLIWKFLADLIDRSQHGPVLNVVEFENRNGS